MSEEHEEKEESIFRQPLGELMRKEISTDFLKKELTLPDFLKKELTLPGFLEKEIPLGILEKEIPLGILEKEIHFGRKRDKAAPEVERKICYSCRKPTPATVATCLNCGAPIEAAYKQEEYEPAPEPNPKKGFPSGRTRKSLIDKAEDML